MLIDEAGDLNFVKLRSCTFYIDGTELIISYMSLVIFIYISSAVRCIWHKKICAQNSILRIQLFQLFSTEIERPNWAQETGTFAPTVHYRNKTKTSSSRAICLSDTFCYGIKNTVQHINKFRTFFWLINYSCIFLAVEKE